MSACARPDLNERLVELVDGADLPELREHADACQKCASELTAMRETFARLAAFTVEPPSEAVLQRAREAARPRATSWGATLGGLALAAALAILFHVQPGIVDQWGALAAAALSVAAWVLGVRAAERGRVADPAFWSVLAGGATLAVISQPSGGVGSLTCLGLGLAAATGPFVVAASGSSAKSGLLLGASAGLLGLIVIRLHCAGGGLSHALLHHLPILVAFAVGGALLSRISPRFRPQT